MPEYSEQYVDKLKDAHARNALIIGWIGVSLATGIEAIGKDKFYEGLAQKKEAEEQNTWIESILNSNEEQDKAA